MTLRRLTGAAAQGEPIDHLDLSSGMEEYLNQAQWGREEAAPENRVPEDRVPEAAALKETASASGEHQAGRGAHQISEAAPEPGVASLTPDLTLTVREALMAESLMAGSPAAISSRAQQEAPAAPSWDELDLHDDPREDGRCLSGARVSPVLLRALTQGVDWQGRRWRLVPDALIPEALATHAVEEVADAPAD